MAVRDDVLARVNLLGDPGSAPVVTPEEVGKIVDAAAIADASGLAPSDPDWVPTYDTYAAIAEVWGLKAARVAGNFNFSADGASYNKADVLANCLTMEAKYAAKARGSLGTISVVPTNGPFTTLDTVARKVIP